MCVLGHAIDSDGGIASDWRAAKRAMWCAFWANSGNVAVASSECVVRSVLLNRTVLPQFPGNATACLSKNLLRLSSIPCKTV